MIIAKFLSNIQWNDTKPTVQLMLETSATKEIRIAMKKGQIMKEHKAPFPITVQILQGKILFGVEGVSHEMETADIIGLEANIPHDLLASEESIIRLSLSKNDTLKRVEKV